MTEKAITDLIVKIYNGFTSNIDPAKVFHISIPVNEFDREFVKSEEICIETQELLFKQLLEISKDVMFFVTQKYKCQIHHFYTDLKIALCGVWDKDGENEIGGIKLMFCLADPRKIRVSVECIFTNSDFEALPLHD